ncbi:MAG: glucosamine-6-phosphate deaminase [Thermoanaerobaculia bacterium]
MRWTVVPDYESLSSLAAARLLDALSESPDIVLGLPTGSTPIGMYRRVVERCGRESHAFERASTFNLDEYVGIPPSHPGSYCTYMKEHLFDHVDLTPSKIHIPDGTGSRILRMQPELTMEQVLEIECHRYERAIADAGALWLTFLGLGRNGHIGFNEPGASHHSRTRVVTLTDSTRAANAPFFGSPEEVPSRAITMGIGTILESRRIVLLASGEGKAPAVARLASGEITSDFPGSALQRHDDVEVIVDRTAATLLDR